MLYTPVSTVLAVSSASMRLVYVVFICSFDPVFLPKYFVPTLKITSHVTHRSCQAIYKAMTSFCMSKDDDEE